MPKRFIVITGEDPVVHTTDDEKKVQSYSDVEFTVVIDTDTGEWFKTGEEDPMQPTELPDLEGPTGVDDPGY